MNEKDILIRFMHSAGFDWITDIAYVNGKELVCSNCSEPGSVWWRSIEVEGSGFNQLFKGAIKRVFINNKD